MAEIRFRFFDANGEVDGNLPVPFQHSSHPSNLSNSLRETFQSSTESLLSLVNLDIEKIKDQKSFDKFKLRSTQSIGRSINRIEYLVKVNEIDWEKNEEDNDVSKHEIINIEEENLENVKNEIIDILLHIQNCIENCDFDERNLKKLNATLYAINSSLKYKAPNATGIFPAGQSMKFVDEGMIVGVNEFENWLQKMMQILRTANPDALKSHLKLMTELKSQIDSSLTPRQSAK